MKFNDILHNFRLESFTQKDRGTRFERLMRSWLLSDPRYSSLTEVWMWEDFPSKSDFGGKDTGIDLVARTDTGDYWAIQCKCYREDAAIDKPEVDSFLATSSRTFKDVDALRTTSFSNRLWISTTNKWGINAEEAIRNQQPQVSRISLVDLQNSPVDWKLLLDGLKGKAAMLPGKQPREHQLRAMSAAHEYFAGHDRGKLITLLGQTLNAWCADASKPVKGICICSDARTSRKIKKDSDDIRDSTVDLAVPATTNPRSIARQLKAYREHDGLTAVFSTYQSIEAVKAAQDGTLKETGGAYGRFDLIVCDEAHRTTGVKLSDRDESSSTKIQDADYIKGNKRLYMTATPRLYGSSAKIKASEKDAILCSKDDGKLYGEEFFRISQKATSRGEIREPDYSSNKISWTHAVLNDFMKSKEYSFTGGEVRQALYRPFFRQNLFWYKPLVERQYQIPKFLPTTTSANLCICVSGVGVNKDFSCIITDQLPDLELIGRSQCFPLYWYEENKVQEQSLFDFDTDSSDKYVRLDGITDCILKEVGKRFGNSKAINREHIFYNVYGLLHSPQYRERFAADLKKTLLRVPIVDNVEDFMAFYKAGKALADLHLNYESVPASPEVSAIIADAVYREPNADSLEGYTVYDHYRLEKMTFPKVRNEAGKLMSDKTRIVYNGNITIENIPVKAYEYIVNGKSAIEWIMDRYAITQDSKSLIVNDPNEWSREHGNPTYIYDLLRSVINLSVQTVDIVNSLPILKL